MKLVLNSKMERDFTYTNIVNERVFEFISIKEFEKYPKDT